MRHYICMGIILENKINYTKYNKKLYFGEKIDAI